MTESYIVDFGILYYYFHNLRGHNSDLRGGTALKCPPVAPGLDPFLLQDADITDFADYFPTHC